MKRRYQFSRIALSDLREIMIFIAKDSRRNARRWLEKIEKKCQDLAYSHALGFPMLQNPQVRIWPVQNYVIVFRRRGEEIEVLRVLHGARDLEGLLGDEPQ